MDQFSRPPVSRRSTRFVLGARAFDRISAVEGLAPTPDLMEADREMTEAALTPAERVAHLKARYGRHPVDR